MPNFPPVDRLLSLLPPNWQARLASCGVEAVQEGMSATPVFRVTCVDSRAYLKVTTGRDGDELRAEIQRTAWLAANGIRAPSILATLDQGGVVAMLTGELSGKRPQDCLDSVEAILATVAQGLIGLHSLPVADCPFDERTPVRLRRALESINRHEIDPAHFAERNRALTAQQIYERLIAEIPQAEDLVVIHGDADFDNLRVDAAGQLGFLDCGRSGRGDRYVDLERVTTSIEERFGPRWVEPFLQSYGLTRWDRDRALFFADLYELF